MRNLKTNAGARGGNGGRERSSKFSRARDIENGDRKVEAETGCNRGYGFGFAAAILARGTRNDAVRDGAEERTALPVERWGKVGSG